MLLPLVRAGSGEMAGFVQVENRSTREESTRIEYYMPRRNDRQALDVQQRASHGTVSCESKKKKKTKIPYISNSIARILIVFLYMFICTHNVRADEGILEAPRLAGPDTVVQFRVEITRRNLKFFFRIYLNLLL